MLYHLSCCGDGLSLYIASLQPVLKERRKLSVIELLGERLTLQVEKFISGQSPRERNTFVGRSGQGKEVTLEEELLEKVVQKTPNFGNGIRGCLEDRSLQGKNYWTQNKEKRGQKSDFKRCYNYSSNCSRSHLVSNALPPKSGFSPSVTLRSQNGSSRALHTAVQWRVFALLLGAKCHPPALVCL